MAFLKKLQINTHPIDPEILVLLAGYRSLGLTPPDDKISLELARTYFDYNNNRYVNCYRFFAQEDELILIDRNYAQDSRNIQSNAVFLLDVPVKHEFEFTDDGSNLFSPDISEIAKHGDLTVYFDPKKEYAQMAAQLQGIIAHYERFKDSSAPMSFFSFPQMRVLGYHVNGGLFGKEELDHIIDVMKEFKHKDADL